MNSARIVAIEPVDAIGRYRVEQARRRLKLWDGHSWEVTALPHPPADRIHVKPSTSESVDWLGYWVQREGDPHFRPLAPRPPET